MRKLIIPAVILVFVCVASAYAQHSPADDATAIQLRQEIVADLTGNILPFWAKNTPDPAGGFYGYVNADATPVPDAAKGGILNARLVWTFSTAYRVLGDEKYRELADRAARYFLDHFIDKEYGGVFWEVNADGTPSNMQKQSYVNAFGIYGLSEHFRATGNIESLQGAISIYEAMIKHVYDPVNGGYIENFSREWVMPDNLFAPKGMNNNLHVLEGLTNLYRVWRDPGLAQHLRRQIDVASHKILDQTIWHENLYMSMDWTNTTRIDSYGHDIEFSWLLVEAAEVLGDEAVLADTRRIAVNIADVQLKEGTMPTGYIKGEKFWEPMPRGAFGAPPAPAAGAKLTKEEQQRQKAMQDAMKARQQEVEKHGEIIEWWPQAEAVVGYVNAWQISGDRKFLDAAVNAWDYIKKYVIDREYGEWYGKFHEDGTPVKTAEKTSMWRCPYHNSRMGFEIMSRIKLKK